MAFVEIPGGMWCGNYLNAAGANVAANTTTLLMDALNEVVQVVGTVRLTGKAASVSFDTNSKILWRTGTAGTYTAGDIITIGVQDVDATNGPPGRGDGVFDCSTTINCNTLANATTQSTAMTTGSKTISHGDQIAIVFQLTTFTAASIKMQGLAATAVLGQSAGYPISNLNNTLPGVVPMPLLLDFEGDGTVLGFIDVMEVAPIESFGTAVTFGSGTEHGMAFVAPATCKIDGFKIVGNVTASTVNTTLTLYKNLVSPTSVATLAVIDGNSVGANNVTREFKIAFPPQTLDGSSTYSILLGPSGNSLTLVPAVFNAINHASDFFGFSSSDLRATRAGGNITTTAKEQFQWAVRVSAIDNAAQTGGAAGLLVHPGLAGGMRG